MRHDKGCNTIHFSDKCPAPQKTRSTQEEPQIAKTLPAFKLDPEQTRALNKAAAQLNAEVEKAQARMVESVIQMFNGLTETLKAQREMLEPEPAKSEGSAGIASAERLKELVAVFRHRWEGQFCDVSGAYGPQAPDLIMEYVRAVTGFDNWLFPEVYAGQFAKTEDGVMASHFKRIALPRAEPERVGDIVIAASPDGLGYIGIITANQFGPTVEMFTQSPIFPAGDFPVKRESVIGVWRPRVKA